MKETVISREDLDKLPEYSCSLPTLTTIGKRWSCMLHHGASAKRFPLEKREWQIGEYVEHSNPEKVGIDWSWAMNENHEPHRGPKER